MIKNYFKKMDIFLLFIIHVIIILVVIVLLYMSYEISLYKNPESSLLKYILGFIIGTLIISTSVHYVLGIPTRFGYYIGVCNYPKYKLY
jgi:hypothetical protein